MAVESRVQKGKWKSRPRHVHHPSRADRMGSEVEVKVAGLVPGKRKSNKTPCLLSVRHYSVFTPIIPLTPTA